MGGLGVITNPRARVNQKNPRLVARLRETLGTRGLLAAPESLDALPEVLADWRRADVGTIAINGGDGTIHRVATAVIRTWGDAPLPRLAILPTGTMNIIANSLGIRGKSEALLHRLLADGDDGPSRTVGTLRIAGDGPPVYGFLFGNGIVARFLEVYYEGSAPTPAKAAWILGRGAASALIGGPAIRRLTRPFTGTVRADGTLLEGTRWTAVAVGTVEQIGLGFKAFWQVNDYPDQMAVVTIAGSALDLARDLPRVYRGVPLQRPGNRGFTATSLEIEGTGTLSYMVDGDFHQAQNRIQLDMGPAFEFVTPR